MEAIGRTGEQRGTIEVLAEVTSGQFRGRRWPSLTRSLWQRENGTMSPQQPTWRWLIGVFEEVLRGSPWCSLMDGGRRSGAG
jgi:hypothetical protein